MDELDVKPNIKVEAVDWVSIFKVLKNLKQNSHLFLTL